MPSWNQSCICKVIYRSLIFVVYYIIALLSEGFKIWSSEILEATSGLTALLKIC